MLLSFHSADCTRYFYDTESIKAIVHLQKFLKYSGNNLLTSVNFFSQNVVSGCQKLTKYLLTLQTPPFLYPSYTNTSMIASLLNSSICSQVSAAPPIIVVTTDNRMNTPFGSIPVPTTVVHTTAVVPPPIGVPMTTSVVDQAIKPHHWPQLLLTTILFPARI